MKKLLLFISSLILFLSFNLNVKALTISLDDVCTSFFYANDQNGVNSTTSYKCGNNNNINLFGQNRLPDTIYSEYLTGFDSHFSNISLKKNVQYTLTYHIKVTNMQQGEITVGRLERFNKSFGFLRGSSNVTLIDSYYDNYRPWLSDTGGVGSAYFNVKIIFIPNSDISSFNLGFNARDGLDPFGFYIHYNDVDFIIEGITLVDDANSVIINQNDTIINQNEQTNENLENIYDSITDESPPNTDGLNGAAGWLPPGPVDSLINLPLSFFNSISRDLGSSCKPVNLPLPYVNKNLTLPCMSTFYDGIKINSFMDWVGLIASGFILFSYLLKLYKWVDDTLTFRENNHLDNWGGV